MGNIERRQFKPPPPIPQGVGPGAKKFHLYRLIVSLYEQLAVARVTAHTHTAAGKFQGVSNNTGTQFEARPPLLRDVSLGFKDEQLYREIVSLYEQLVAFQDISHLHTPTGAAIPR